LLSVGVAVRLQLHLDVDIDSNQISGARVCIWHKGFGCTVGAVGIVYIETTLGYGKKSSGRSTPRI